MRIPFLSLFHTSPFEGIQEHAEKVKECAWVFQHAIECHMLKNCESFGDLREKVRQIEREADSIKRRIRGHLPVGTLMPVDKFQLFRYLREQDQVLDALEDALDWISFRESPGIMEEFQKEFLLLIEAVIAPIEELSKMVEEARKYFKTYSDKQRTVVKDIIRNIRKQENEADRAEEMVKRKLFHAEAVDPVTILHLVRLAEILGSVADHAENTGDMMRAMIAR